MRDTWEIDDLPRGLREQAERKLGAAPKVRRPDKAPPHPPDPLPAELACGHPGCTLQAGCAVPHQTWKMTIWARPTPSNAFLRAGRREHDRLKIHWRDLGVAAGREYGIPRVGRFLTIGQVFYRRTHPVIDPDGIDLSLKAFIDGLGTRHDDDTGQLTTAGVLVDDTPCLWHDGAYLESGYWCSRFFPPAIWDPDHDDHIDVTVVTLGPHDFPHIAFD